MERRGDGVAIILKGTRETSGAAPEYAVVDDASLLLRNPAATLALVPAAATVTVHAEGTPLAGVEVLVLFPNKTRQRATTDASGEASVALYTTHLPMTVYAATPGYTAGLHREWRPDRGGLLLEVRPLPGGGAAIFPRATGNLPGLRGRLNPVRDALDRTYLYADNIAVEEGRQQPVPFRRGKAIRLTDAHGAELSATIVDIVGRSALLEYRPWEI